MVEVVTMARAVVREARLYGKARLGVGISVALKDALARTAFEAQSSIGDVVEALCWEALAARGVALAAPDPMPAESGQQSGTSDEILTLPQVAERLGVSRQRVHVFVKEGRLRAGRDGRRLLIAASEVERFKNERG